MEDLPFYFVIGVVVWGVLRSGLEMRRRMGSPHHRSALPAVSPERQPWECPSCGRSIEPSSDTCPWCYWADVSVEEEGEPEPPKVEDDEPPPQPEPADEPPPEPEPVKKALVEQVLPGDPVPSLAESVEAILAEGVIGGRRDSLIKALVGQAFSIELSVGRVERTLAMFSDPAFRDGRTVTGTIGGTEIQVSVLFPHTLNEEVDSMEPGETYPIQGAVTEWDRLRLRPTMRATGP
jgi:hypothetical protein